MPRWTRRLFGFFLTCLSLGLITGLQQAYDLKSQKYKAAQVAAAITFKEPLVPSSTALQFLSLGDKQVVADMLWLDTVQYFGSGNPYGQYAGLGPMLTRITDLDPQFEYPYEFAMVVLPYMGQTDTAVKLGEKAQTTQPGNGLLTYYLASIYHLNVKDYRKAAFYYKKASTQEGAPGAANELAGVALARLEGTLDDRLVAMTFWDTVYKNAKNDDDRKRAKDWYDTLVGAYQIEKAAQDYKTAHGSYPATLQDLVTSRLLPSIPIASTGRDYAYNPKTGTVNFN